MQDQATQSYASEVVPARRPLQRELSPIYEAGQRMISGVEPHCAGHSVCTMQACAARLFRTTKPGPQQVWHARLGFPIPRLKTVKHAK